MRENYVLEKALERQRYDLPIQLKLLPGCQITTLMMTEEQIDTALRANGDRELQKFQDIYRR